MTKTEFLQQLYNNLSPLTDSERKEIIQDFEEHFSAGLESGKTEERICSELGSPESCAAPYLQGINASGQYARAKSAGASYTVPAVQKVSANPNDGRNRFLWSVMFLFLVICAFGVYPTAFCLMLSPLAVALLALLVLAVSWTGAAAGFLICLSISLFSAGLLIFLAMTALLKMSFKKSGF